MASRSRPRDWTLRSNQTSDGTVAGNLHIHSRDSDGGGSLDEIAAAASRAGLKFIVLTDHGDATGQPSAPVYREGVLCLGGVEISTAGGHYLAIGLPEAPYPLGGEARDVVEDVKRLGGFGIAAHPDSQGTICAGATGTTPFDALEIVNPDTSWRVHVQQRDGARSCASLKRSRRIRSGPARRSPAYWMSRPPC